MSYTAAVQCSLPSADGTGKGVGGWAHSRETLASLVQHPSGQVMNSASDSCAQRVAVLNGTVVFVNGKAG